VLTFALDNSLDAMGEQIFGHPKPELIARWRKIHEFFDEPRLASLLNTFWICLASTGHTPALWQPS
jgi:hypothetical protein